MNWLNQTHIGDCRRLMRQMIADGVKVNCVITSPPYWGLRDYGTAQWFGGDLGCSHIRLKRGNRSTIDGGHYQSREIYPHTCACGARRVDRQFGLESTWQRHVARMRGVFRLVRELLAPDGTLWLNYGDSYAGAPGGFQGGSGQRASRTFTARIALPKRGGALKPKDLVGMPWRVALALQDDGWYLRSDIVWSKPNPMPESVDDRPTKAHEYVFLLTRSDRYYYNADAIREKSSPESHARASRARLTGHMPPGQTPQGGLCGPHSGIHKKISGWASRECSHSTIDHASDQFDLTPNSGKFGHNGVGFGNSYDAKRSPRVKQNPSFSASVVDVVETRNARSVWTIPTQPFVGAHFATFPEELVRRCIATGSRPGDTIFDPFMGSGTVAQVATDLGRNNFLGCELNPEYVELHELRRTTIGMPI